MIWPIYPLFSRIYPMVLGMPFSLFYIVAVIVTVFSVDEAEDVQFLTM